MAEFKVNDRVIIGAFGSGGKGEVKGTVVNVGNGLIDVARDDNFPGTGINDSWMVFPHHLRIDTDEPVLIACDAEAVEADKRGYRPDGFNPEAHRSFMKDLGGGS